MTRYAATVTVRASGLPIGEVRVEAGQRLSLGADGPLDLPAPPSGGPWLTLRWVRGDAVEVTGVDGSIEIVGPADTWRLSAGTLDVDVDVAPAFQHRRLGPIAVAGSISLLASMLAVSLVVAQVDLAWRLTACPVFGVGCPSPGAGDDGFNAELLARLLRGDIEGEVNQGLIVSEPPEQRHPIVVKGFLPAGDSGPATQLGGAEQVRAEPERRPEQQAVRRPRPAPEDKPLQAAPAGEAMLPEAAAPTPETPADGQGDLAIKTPDEDEPAVTEASDGRAEEVAGWGFRDWMDAQVEVDRQVLKREERSAKLRVVLDPDSPSALSALAFYQYLQEDYKAAEATYNRYIEVIPDDAGGYNNLALVYKRLGQYAREEGLYRLALAMEPDDVVALNNLAVCLAHQGRFAEALDIMKRLETLDPGDAYADLHRAKIHAAMGEDEVAISFMRRALENMRDLSVMNHIEFRQDIRIDPALARLRQDPRVLALLVEYYGGDSPLGE